MLTLHEIDETLAVARDIPEKKRGRGWAAMVDALLEQRSALTQTIEEKP